MFTTSIIELNFSTQKFNNYQPATRRENFAFI